MEGVIESAVQSVVGYAYQEMDQEEMPDVEK